MAPSNTSQPSFIGIDLCEPLLRAAIVNGNGEVLERRDGSLDGQHVVAQVSEMVTTLRDSGFQAAAVGVAIPGLVNRFTDRVLVSTELPTTVREDLHGELIKATGL